MQFKEITESARIVIPIILFLAFTIYLITSDSSVIGPF